jgi:hypothetical protein
MPELKKPPAGGFFYTGCPGQKPESILIYHDFSSPSGDFAKSLGIGNTSVATDFEKNKGFTAITVFAKTSHQINKKVSYKSMP